MKEKLEQLTLSQFVDLVCGDTGVLLGNNEIGNPNKLAVATRSIVLEYRAIADPGATGSYFKHVEDWIKAKMNVIIFTMCGNLVSLKQYGRAREVLVDSTAGWTAPFRQNSHSHNESFRIWRLRTRKSMQSVKRYAAILTHRRQR